jgi:non-reducing end alpha-L-arabinofuranosidase
VKHLRSDLRVLLSSVAILVAAEACSSSGGSDVQGTGGAGGKTSSTGGRGSGGSSPAGGSTGNGGSAAAGGILGSGGILAAGGNSGRGGTTGNSAGGAGGLGTSSGGNSAGGNSSDAAAGGQGGASGGTAGAIDGGGTTGNSTGPCDIYAAGNTPCVAAHSTVRALYGAYSGKLYQVRRASDKTTKDIPTLTSGGFADSAQQETFCSGTTCTLSIIYDQSPNANHLPKSPKAQWLGNGGKEADAAGVKIKVGGHPVYGVYVVANQGIAYRVNTTKGVATGDQPEAMYMVLDGKRYSDKCCFDYGNAESNGLNNGNGTMEAIYWGSNTSYARGGGPGPWVAADLENGMYEGDSGNTPSNTSVTGMAYVTAMLIGPSGNRMILKAGDAQNGTLVTKWDGKRPPNGYTPMKKEGAIILGTGGDGSSSNDGTFFEGAMTTGVPTNATDDAVQANIVAAGYGR